MKLINQTNIFMNFLFSSSFILVLLKNSMENSNQRNLLNEYQLKEEIDDDDIDSNSSTSNFIGPHPQEIVTSVNPSNGYPVRQENGQRKTGPPPGQFSFAIEPMMIMNRFLFN